MNQKLLTVVLTLLACVLFLLLAADIFSYIFYGNSPFFSIVINRAAALNLGKNAAKVIWTFFWMLFVVAIVIAMGIAWGPWKKH